MKGKHVLTVTRPAPASTKIREPDTILGQIAQKLGLKVF
jgi:hypothetical protein